jgi:hypothetical protein
MAQIIKRKAVRSLWDIIIALSPKYLTFAFNRKIRFPDKLSSFGVVNGSQISMMAFADPNHEYSIVEIIPELFFREKRK